MKCPTGFIQTSVLFALCLLLTPALQVDCGPQDSIRYTNATDSFTMNNPFRTPEGPYSTNTSSNWTWQLNTQSPDRLENGTTNIRQSLSLSVSPPPSPGLFEQDKYVGCGLIIHGAFHEKVVKGQSDLQGDCTGFISDGCREALLSEAEFNAKYLHVRKKKKPKDKPTTDLGEAGVCGDLAVLKFNRTLKKCKNDFAPGAWLEPFMWASAALNSSQCTGDTSSFVAHTWGESTYNSTSLREYNNLTTSIEPIVTTFHNADRDSTSWAKAHVICLRSGENVTNGSSKPLEVPEGPFSSALMPAVPLTSLLFGIGGAMFITFI